MRTPRESLPRKLIGSVEHLHLPCLWCGELVWRQFRMPFVCDSCLDGVGLGKSAGDTTCGGGVRVVRKGGPES